MAQMIKRLIALLRHGLIARTKAIGGPRPR